MESLDSLLVIVVLCMLVGVVQGFLAGLLGIGGGIVLVPVFLLLLPHLNIPTEMAIHIAIGTSLGAIILTSYSAALGHRKRGNISWPVARALLPGIIIGSISGGFIADGMSAETLTRIFAIFLLLMALKMVLPVNTSRERPLPSPSILFFSAMAIGAFSALMGIGGGVILVPFLTFFGLEMRKSIGCAAAAGIAVALFGCLSYVIAGWNEPGLPQYAVGYVYLPAQFGVIATAIFTARLGVKAAAILPIKLLKRIFAAFMTFIGLRLLLG